MVKQKKIHDMVTWLKKSTVYAIYFASLIFRESGRQDIYASG